MKCSFWSRLGHRFMPAKISPIWAKLITRKWYTSHGNQGAITKIRNSYWADESKKYSIHPVSGFLQRLTEKLLKDHISGRAWAHGNPGSLGTRKQGLAGWPVGNACASSCLDAAQSLRAWHNQEEKTPVVTAMEFPVSPIRWVLGIWWLRFMWPLTLFIQASEII